MMRPVLLVTKDQSEFNQNDAIKKRLDKKGFPVYVAAEAISLDKWTESGHEVIGGKPSPEHFDPNTGMRYDIDPAKVLEDLKPRVVIIGLARPINLGEKFAIACAEYNSRVHRDEDKIIIGFVEDLWGVHGRCSVVPDFICTLDDRGVNNIKAKPKYTDTRVIATGNPAMDSLFDLKADSRMAQISAGYKRVVLAAGQDYSTTPMLEGLVTALDRVGDYLLLVRLHPKWTRVTEDTVRVESDAQKRAVAEKQLAAGNRWRHLAFSAKKGEVMLVRNLVSTQELMLSAHVVVSIFSNTLLEAAILGRIPVSWNSPVGRQMMAGELDGITRYPLCDYGAAIEVETPGEYAAKVPEFGSNAHDRMKEITIQRFRPGQSAEQIAGIVASYF